MPGEKQARHTRMVPVQVDILSVLRPTHPHFLTALGPTLARSLSVMQVGQTRQAVSIEPRSGARVVRNGELTQARQAVST